MTAENHPLKIKFLHNGFHIRSKGRYGPCLPIQIRLAVPSQIDYTLE